MPETVLVIGASRGIGEELLEVFEHAGHDVYGFARSFQNGTADRRFHLDLNAPTLKSDLEKILEGVEKIDVLVNNAGAIAVKPFTELTRDEITEIYQVNVIGVMESIQACLPKMKPGSHIVNISSMGGFQGSAKFPGLSAYSPSKAAVASLTELLAEELKEQGIRVNCLCLGAVQTEMLAKAFPGYQAPHTATEMAGFIADFALASGKFFNGKILPVSISTP